MKFHKCVMMECKIWSYDVRGWMPDAKNENFICPRCMKYLEALKEEVDAIS